MTDIPISIQEECLIQKYWESRGFTIRRLDDKERGANPEQACEWFIHSDSDEFLCEVKTITSVKRGKSTGDDFKKKLRDRVKSYIQSVQKFQGLSYRLRIDSDDCYVPPQEDLNKFLKWLKHSLLNIDAGNIPHGWSVGKANAFQYFYASYSFRSAVSDDTSGADIQLFLYRTQNNELEVTVHWYGDLNASRIEDVIKKAQKQLQKSSESYPNAARLIILTFASQTYTTVKSEQVAFSGLAFMEDQLWCTIQRSLKKHPSLSAIAILDWQQINTPRFWVIHNPYLQVVKPLNKSVFDDGDSTQFFPEAG